MYRKGRHVVSNMHVHLIFVTKWRRKVFDAEHITFLGEVFASVCDDFEATLEEFNGETEHVHLLVSYPPKVAISNLVNSLKGVSSRRFAKKFGRVHRWFYKGVLWSPSYFAASCSGAPLSIIKQYIEQQASPEAD